jgi:hypothetical protein
MNVNVHTDSSVNKNCSGSNHRNCVASCIRLISYSRLDNNNNDDDDDDDKSCNDNCHLHFLEHKNNNKKARSSRIRVIITASNQSVGFPRQLLVCASSFFTYQRTRLKS